MAPALKDPVCPVLGRLTELLTEHREPSGTSRAAALNEDLHALDERARRLGASASTIKLIRLTRDGLLRIEASRAKRS